MYGEKKVIDENVEKGMLCAIFLTSCLYQVDPLSYEKLEYPQVLKDL